MFLERLLNVADVGILFFEATLTYSAIQRARHWRSWVNTHTRCSSVTQPLSQSNYTYTNIVFRALFMNIRGAFVLGGCCVFMCGSTGLLFVEAVLDYYCRKRQLGMCLSSVGSGLAVGQTHRWPESQSLFFLWLSCSDRSQASPSLSLSFSFSSRRPPSLPLADEDISSCKQRTKEQGLETRQSHGRICHSAVMECL